MAADGRSLVVRVLPSEEERAKEILALHTGRDWSLCDSVSFAVLEKRHIRRAL
jgi:hypothetical protein